MFLYLNYWLSVNSAHNEWKFLFVRFRLCITSVPVRTFSRSETTPKLLFIVPLAAEKETNERQDAKVICGFQIFSGKSNLELEEIPVVDCYFLLLGSFIKYSQECYETRDNGKIPFKIYDVVAYFHFHTAWVTEHASYMYLNLYHLG